MRGERFASVILGLFPPAGHKVEKEDRIPMRTEYNQYKKIKTKLKQVERKIESMTYATK